MNTETWARRNPFADGYFWRELNWYTLKNFPAGGVIYERDGLVLRTTQPTPMVRLDDWLNVNLRTNLPPMPQLYRDRELWMSITPMEMQSQHLPIQWAVGKTATAGLGLGHFALRAAQKNDVDEVHVFEADKRVIDMFYAVHGRRKAVQKIHIHHGDARELLAGEYAFAFDSLYCDIYADCGGDEVIDDLRLFLPRMQKPLGFTWWGMEVTLLNALVYEIVDQGDLPWSLAAYYRQWQRSKLGRMRMRVLDFEYCERVVAVLREHDWFL